MPRTIKAEAGKAWTVAMVVRAVADIEALAGDDEMQHGAEDRLYREVLASIAGGRVAADQIRAVAAAALTTLKLDFARWCA